MTETTDQFINVDIDRWLKSHHNVEKSSDGSEIHVFALEHGAVFGDISTAKTFEVAFGIGPLTFFAFIEVGAVKETFTVTVYVDAPLFHKIKLGSGSGDRVHEVYIRFDQRPLVDGLLQFYIKGGWFWVHHAITIFSKPAVGSIRLIPA